MPATAAADRARSGLLTGFLIMVIGLDLRPAITSVGPVLDQVRGRGTDRCSESRRPGS